MKIAITIALSLAFCVINVAHAQTCEPYSIVTVGGANTVGYFESSLFDDDRFGTCRAVRSGSNCVGLGREGIGGYQPDMKQLLADSLTPIEIYNYAGNNVRTSDWEQIGNQIALDFPPGELDLVLLLGGTEDILAGVSINTIGARLQNAVAEALLRGQFVLVGTLPPLSDSFYNGRVNSLNSRIRSTAAEFDIPIADHNSRLRGSFSRYSNDGVTINDAGHAVMAQVWIDAIYDGLERAALDNQPVCRNPDFIIDNGKDATCATLDRTCRFGIVSFSFFGDKVRNEEGNPDAFAYGEELGVTVTRLSRSNSVYMIDWSEGINAGAILPLDLANPGVINDTTTKVDEFSTVRIKPGFVGEFEVTIKAVTNFGGGRSDCCFLPWDTRELETIKALVRIESAGRFAARFIPSIILLLLDEDDQN